MSLGTGLNEIAAKTGTNMLVPLPLRAIRSNDLISSPPKHLLSHHRLLYSIGHNVPQTLAWNLVSVVIPYISLCMSVYGRFLF